MASWKKRIYSLAWLLMLGMGSAYAQSTTPLKTPMVRAVSHSINNSDVASRKAIVLRANSLFALLGGEMALQAGDAGTALATYMMALNRTKDPEVAERAMEMAMSLHAYRQADAIYQKWREIEPVPSEAQKRLAWSRNLMMGYSKQALVDMGDVFEHANAVQKQRMFLLLAQMSVQNPQLAKEAGNSVHKLAQRELDMPEAAIADVIFSAQNGKNSNAIKALQNLARLDAEILPPTELTLRLLAQRNPEVLNAFFAKTDTNKLSPIWQELEISSLVASGKIDEAYTRLQALLKQNPNADLYTQAALLSAARGENIIVGNGYLEKAYMLGTQEQQSRAAVLAAMRYADAKDYVAAQTWLNKVVSPDYQFDKLTLQASLDVAQDKWQAALENVRGAQKLADQQGHFVNADDLLRIQLFALSKVGEPQEVLRELNAWIAQAEKEQGAESRLSELLYQRALLQADQLNQPEKAIADLRRCLTFNPNSAEVLNALGYTMLLVPSENHNAAFKMIQMAYQINPESAAINDSMGWGYYLQGDAEAALPYLQYAYQQFPDAEVAAHLGEVLWKLGKPEEARAVLTKALQGEGDVAQVRTVMQRLGMK